jgi:hypothetical protein
MWVPVAACLAALSLPRLVCYSKRFSLRALLMVTTLVAVVLGLIVWAAK